MTAGPMTACLANTLTPWFRKGIGRALLVLCGVAHSTLAYFTAGHSIALTMATSGGSSLVLDVLFLLAPQRPAG